MSITRSGAVLIVGGFGALGTALVPRLSEHSFPVVIGDLKRNREFPYKNLFYHRLNATSQKSIESFRQRIEDEGIQLSHIINVVGVLKESGLTDLFKTTGAEITRTLELNLKSQINVIRFLGKHLAASPDTDKSITMISSINAIRGYSIPVYSAAKAGLLGLLQPMAMNLGEDGIRINAVSPGTVQTPSTEQQPKNYGARAEAAALKRLCTADEVADAIIACITLTGMTGQNLVIDAGQTAGAEESLYAQVRQDPELRRKLRDFRPNE